MAINTETIIPQKGFNGLFTLIENCDIIEPPYAEQYETPAFFFRRRDGIQEVVSDTNYTFYDIKKYQTKTIVITVDNTTDEIVLFDLSGTTLTEEGRYAKGNVVKMLEVSGGGIDIGGSILDTGTVTFSCDTTGTDSLTAEGVLEDNTKLWAENEYAGTYVYIEDGTGAGALRYISRNDATHLYVSGWDVTPQSGATYKIYPKITNNIIVPYNGGIVRFDGNSWVDIFVFDGTNVRDIAVWNSRLWYENNGLVFYSYEGDYYFYIANNFITTSITIHSLTPTGNYLIVGSDNNISIIYEAIEIEGKVFYTMKEVYSNMGILNYGAITLYQGGVYIIGKDKGLYAIQIQDMGGGNVQANLVDQGLTPNIFLENNTGDVKIYGLTQGLNIYTIDGNSKELNFLKRYEGYTNNSYGVNIKNKTIIDNELYVMGDGYIGKIGGDNDLGTNIDMKIKSSILTQNIFQWKDIKSLNVMLGNLGVDVDGKISFTQHIGNRKNTIVLNLGNSEYLSDIQDSINQDLLGSDILGINTLGGETDYYDNISDVDTIKIPLDKTGQFFNITLENENGKDLIFGGLQLYYNSISPLLNSYKNIL